MAVVLRLSTATMVAVSGNFTEGDTTTENVYDKTIDGGDSWSRRHVNVWGDDDDESEEY